MSWPRTIRSNRRAPKTTGEGPQRLRTQALAQAAIAQEYYVRAIHICFENTAEYRNFLASNYTDAN